MILGLMNSWKHNSCMLCTLNKLLRFDFTGLLIVIWATRTRGRHHQEHHDDGHHHGRCHHDGHHPWQPPWQMPWWTPPPWQTPHLHARPDNECQHTSTPTQRMPPLHDICHTHTWMPAQPVMNASAMNTALALWIPGMTNTAAANTSITKHLRYMYASHFFLVQQLFDWNISFFFRAKCMSP